MTAGKNKEAAEFIEKSLRKGNSEPWMWQALTTAYTALNDRAGLLRVMTQDLVQHPRDAAAHFGLAHTFISMDRGAEAVRELKSPCELLPENAARHRELLS